MIHAIKLLGDAPLPTLEPRKPRRPPTKFTTPVRKFILDNRNKTVKEIQRDLATIGHHVSIEGIYMVRRVETLPCPRLRRLLTACRHLPLAKQAQIADILEAHLRQIVSQK